MKTSNIIIVSVTKEDLRLIAWKIIELVLEVIKLLVTLFSKKVKYALYR